MATKTITIDLEAYRRLCEVRRDNESFSRVIKRAVKPPPDLEGWLRNVRRTQLGFEAREAVERHLVDRRKHSTRSR